MPIDARIPLLAAQGAALDLPALDQAVHAQRMAQMQEQAIRQKQQADAQQMALEQQAGNLASAGDLQGADNLALSAGDFELHKQIAGLEDEHRQAVARRSTSAAKVAIGLMQNKVPYEQRKAVIEAASPDLIANGWTPDEISSFDPTDSNLGSLITSAQSVDKALEAYNKAQEPFTLGQDQVRYDGAGNVIARGPESIKAVTTPEGSTTTIFGGAGHTGIGGQGDMFDRMIGIESGGQQLTSSGAPLVSRKGAIGIAQLMPSTAPEAARLAGVAFDPQRLATDAAYNRQLGEAYFNSLVQRYGGDQLKAAAAYNAGPGRVDAAIKAGGDAWQTRLPAETRAYVAKLGAGGPMVIHGQPKPEDNTPLSNDAVEFVAQQVAAGGDMPALGMGKQAGMLRARIIARAAQIAKQTGLSPVDVLGIKSDRKANAAALSTLQRTANQVLAYERTANANASQVLATMGKGAAGSAPIINRWIQAGRSGVGGDADVSRFNLAVQTFATEYARVVSGASGGAVTSDSARHEIMGLINNAMTPDQLRAVIGQAQKEMENRRNGLNDQANELRGLLRGKQAGNQPPDFGNPPPPARAVPKNRPSLQSIFGR